MVVWTRRGVSDLFRLREGEREREVSLEGAEDSNAGILTSRNDGSERKKKGERIHVAMKEVVDMITTSEK